MNPDEWLSSILGKNICGAGDWTSNLLFSNLQRYCAIGLGKIKLEMYGLGAVAGFCNPAGWGPGLRTVWGHSPSVVIWSASNECPQECVQFQMNFIWFPWSAFGFILTRFYGRWCNHFLLPSWLTNSHTMTRFDAPGKQAFWKHCGKRRNCLSRAISPFPTVFSTHLDNFLPFSSNFKLSSANSFSLEESKICHLVMI